MTYLASKELGKGYAVLLEVRGDRLRVSYRVIGACSGVFFEASDPTVDPAPIAMPVTNL